MNYYNNKAEKDCKKDEFFIGNTTDISNFPRPELRNLKTIRLGTQAYDFDGKEINRNIYLPVFIHKSEFQLHSTIMTNLGKDKTHQSQINDLFYS